jgi:hypothetical protein
LARGCRQAGPQERRHSERREKRTRQASPAHFNQHEAPIIVRNPETVKGTRRGALRGSRNAHGPAHRPVRVLGGVRRARPPSTGTRAPAAG